MTIGLEELVVTGKTLVAGAMLAEETTEIAAVNVITVVAVDKEVVDATIGLAVEAVKTEIPATAILKNDTNQ